MNKIIIPLIMIILVSGGAFLLMSNSEEATETENTANTTSQNNSNEDSDTAAAGEQYTASDVAEHATETNCWTYIGSNVYDITTYIPRHPGGDEILLACGGDGTSLFESRTTSDGQKIGSGTSHSSNASSQLSDLRIGTLAQ